MTTNKDYPECLITGIALEGLHGKLKLIVMPPNRKTLEDLRKAARLAEKTVLSTSANAASGRLSADDITKRVLDAVTDKISEVLAPGVDRRVEPDPRPPQRWSRQLIVVTIEIVCLKHNLNRNTHLSVRVILLRMGTEINCQMTAEQPRLHSKTNIKWKSMLPPL